MTKGCFVADNRTDLYVSKEQENRFMTKHIDTHLHGKGDKGPNGKDGYVLIDMDNEGEPIYERAEDET